MSFMNFSGAVRPGYQTNRTSTLFVGDSITWGYKINQNQTIAYNVQKQINTTKGLVTGGTYGAQATWGGSSPGLDICVRNVIIDDTTTTPFNGGAPPDGTPLLSPTSVANAGLGVYPFSDTTGNTNGGDVSSSYTGTFPDAITLQPGSNITWTANYPSSTNAYILVGLMGAGTVNIKQNGTTFTSLTVGGIFTASIVSGSTTMTLTSNVTGTLYAPNSFSTGSILYPNSGTGIPYAAYPATTGTTISSFTGQTSGNTITMSAAATLTKSDTFLALAPNTSPNGSIPFVVTIPTSPGAAGTNTYTIANDATGSGANVVVTMLHPTMYLPPSYNEVQINGRNSYAISDFSSPSGDTIAKQIMGTVTQARSASTSSPPIYILSVGTVSLYDSGSHTGGSVDRRLTPAQYSAQLSTLATAFTNSSYYNYGRIILTVPPVPANNSPAGAWTLLSPYTLNSYRQAIIALAKTLGCGYIDLTRVLLTWNATSSLSDYQDDGLHPTAQGAAKLAKYYNSMLEF